MPQTTKKELDIRTSDGLARAWAYRPAGEAKVPAIIFYVDALAVRPAMHAMAEELATKGYFVLLPNVFYRAGEFAPFNVATCWGDPPERARVMALLQGLPLEAAMRDAGAWLDAIANEPNVRADAVGAIGYCLGGRLAVATAGNHPDRLQAAASFHGGNLVSDAKDSPHLLASKIKAALYFGVADEDASCSPEAQGKLATALGAAHVAYQIELYKGKKHGFAVLDHGDAAATERHWRRVTAFFSETLGGGRG